MSATGREARAAAAIAAALAVVWHFREISRLSRIPDPTFPFLTTTVALGATFLAVYVWFGGRHDE